MYFTMYKKQIGIIGSRNLSRENLELVTKLSEFLIDEGYRTVTGGLGSLQESVHRGAKLSKNSSDCDTIAIIPGFNPSELVNCADVIIPTGIDLYRNVMVANSEVVIAVEGGAGTLSEIAYAWQLNRPIIAIGKGGWAEKLSGVNLDSRRPKDHLIDCIGDKPEEIIDQVIRLTNENYQWHKKLE